MRVRQAGRHLRRQHPRLPGRHGRSRWATTTASKAQWIAAQNGIVIKIVGEQAAARSSTSTGDDVADTPARRARHRRRRAGEARRRSTTPGKSLWRVGDHPLHAVGLQLAVRPARRRRRPGQGGPDGGDPPGDDPCARAARSSSARTRCSASSRRSPARRTRSPTSPTACPAAAPSDTLEIPLTRRDPPASLARVDAGDRGRRPHDHAARSAARRTSQLHVRLRRPRRLRAPGPGRPEGRRHDRLRLPGRLPHAGHVRARSFAAIGGAVLSANRTRQEISRQPAVERRWSAACTRAAERARPAGARRPPHLRPDRPHALHAATAPSARRRARTSTSSATHGKSGLARPEGIGADAPTARCSSPTPRAHVVRRFAPGRRRRRSSPARATRRLRRRRRRGDRGPARQPARRRARPGRRALHRRRAATTASAAIGTTATITHARRHRRRAATRATAARRTRRCSTSPSDVAVDAGGAVYVVDRANHAVRRIGPDGVIATLAGNGVAGLRRRRRPGRHAHACARRATSPCARDGSVLVADSGNHRVRRIDPDGTIATVAGNGAPAYARRRRTGDRRARSTRRRRSPPLRDGGVLLADSGHTVLRMVALRRHDRAPWPATATHGFARRRRRRPAQARLDFPPAIALGADDTLYVADAGNDRVRARRAEPARAVGSASSRSPPTDGALALRVRPQRPPPADRRRAHRRDRADASATTRAGRLTAISDGDGAHDDDRSATRPARRPRSSARYGQRTTLRGRRRRLPELGSTNPAGERIAARRTTRAGC